MLGQVSCTRFFAKNLYKVQHVLWCGDAVDPGVVWLCLISHWRGLSLLPVSKVSVPSQRVMGPWSCGPG